MDACSRSVRCGLQIPWFGGILNIDFVNGIGLLDSDQMTTFEMFTADGGMTLISDCGTNGGNNSLELVQIWKPDVTQIAITLGASGAVARLDLTTCPDPTMRLSGAVG
jgi:hypothetical protein